MNIWTKGEKDWYTEASDLGLPPGQPPTVVTLPNAEKTQTASWWWNANHVNGDGEVISWFCIHEGVRYEIFND